MRKYEKHIIELKSRLSVLNDAADAMTTDTTVIRDVSRDVRASVRAVANIRRLVGWQSLSLFKEMSDISNTLQRLLALHTTDTHQIERAIDDVRELIEKNMTQEALHAIAFGTHILPHTQHHNDPQYAEKPRPKKQPGKIQVA